jgi:localization factor PodJL
MAASVPWSVSAVDPEAWATARDAARRAGVSVGEWLESAIRDSAHEPARPHRGSSYDPSKAIEQRLDDLAERLDHFARRAPEPVAPTRNAQSELALFASIDALNDRIDDLMRDVRGDRNGPAEVRAAIQRLDDRIEQLVSRGRLANGGAAPELERKVDDISRTIESLSRRIEQESTRYIARAPAGIDELDAAIAEIMVRQSALDGVAPPRDMRRAPAASAPDFGRLESQLKTLTDEMQAIRRAGVQAETIDALRREIGTLAHQLADLAPRRSIEALETSVASLARRFDRAAAGRPDETLTEVVGALHDIRSALADVRPAESFTSVEKDLHDLSSKLDSLNVRGVDAETVARLQTQTAEIRDLLSGALPSEVLKALVEQIELLVRKFESGASAPDHALLDMVAALDRRIESLSARIEAGNRPGPEQGALDDIRTRLDELRGAVAEAGRGSAAGIEVSLQALSQKIEAAESRLGSLGTIERGLTDLFKQLQEFRANPREHALPALAAAERPRPPLTELDTKYSSASDLSARAAAYAEPLPTTVRPLAPADIDDPQDDVPLEPGSGAPRMRMQSAALRVAQSEAALGGIGSPTPAASTRTSDFIAAARRAAQAAAAEPTREPSRIVEASMVGGIVTKFGGRRALLIALTAFLLLFTAFRFFDGNLPNLFFSDPVATVVPKPAQPAPARPEQNTPSSQDRSSLSEPSNIALAPPAGVIGGGRDVPFLGDIVVDPATTGTTVSTKPAKAPIQTASTPPAGEDNLPAALGTPALRAAAVAGDPIAAYEIGARYLEGRGVRADPAEAANWLERALAKGSAPAAYRLGNIYEKGHGVAKNPAEAMRYYTIAAEAGNVKAMHNLAVMFAEGPDGKPDYRNAVRWFRMAGERGVRDSQYNLGVLYARGLGVEQNLAESFRWFSLAANQGDGDAGKKRDDVAKRLDVQTLVAAKLAIQTWAPTASDAAANEVRLKPEWETADGHPRKRSVKK